jgi:hypothetical protein
MFWINVKLDGDCPCPDFDLSSHIALGANKENLMCRLVIRTLRLWKEMQPISNNVMSFSNLNIFDFKYCW